MIYLVLTVPETSHGEKTGNGRIVGAMKVWGFPKRLIPVMQKYVITSKEKIKTSNSNLQVLR